MKNIVISIHFAILTLLLIYFTGCATIISGTEQLVTINSNVKDAIIRLDGIVIGNTPFVGEIPKNGKVITIEKQGYQTHQIAMYTELEGTFWLNILTGGTLGSITDVSSGAAYKYSPASFHVELIEDDVSVDKFKEKFEIRKFAMMNMSNIAIDISNNSGVYLETMAYLAKLNYDVHSKELIKQKLIQSDGDQVVFGNLIVELLDDNN